MVCIARFCSVLLLSAMGFCQLPSTCDSIQSTIKDCISLIRIDPAQNEQLVGTVPSAPSLFPRASANRESKPMNFTADAPKTKPSAIGNDFSISANMLVLTRSRKPGFRWKRALFESFTFLSIEQAYVVKDDFRWVGECQAAQPPRLQSATCSRGGKARYPKSRVGRCRMISESDRF